MNGARTMNSKAGAEEQSPCRELRRATALGLSLQRFPQVAGGGAVSRLCDPVGQCRLWFRHWKKSGLQNG